MRRMTNHYILKLALTQNFLVVKVQNKYFIKQNIRGYYFYNKCLAMLQKITEVTVVDSTEVTGTMAEDFTDNRRACVCSVGHLSA